MLWSFALVAALLTAQLASQLHGFEHVRYDLARADATAAAQAGGKESAPKLGHSAFRCLEFQAFDCAVVSTALTIFASALPFSPVSQPSPAPRLANTPPFSARAPPVLR
jgi:hypothetical protein